jgi:hypothetical protein
MCFSLALYALRDSASVNPLFLHEESEMGLRDRAGTPSSRRGCLPRVSSGGVGQRFFDLVVLRDLVAVLCGVVGAGLAELSTRGAGRVVLLGRVVGLARRVVGLVMMVIFSLLVLWAPDP